jgi:hypothetical protein
MGPLKEGRQWTLTAAVIRFSVFALDNGRLFSFIKWLANTSRLDIMSAGSLTYRRCSPKTLK